MTGSTTHQQFPDLGTEDGIRHAALVYGPELRAFAARRLADRAYAEDVVQETLLRAWKSADRFDATRGTMRTWLYAILRNLLVDLARARGRRVHATPATTEVVAPDAFEELLGSISVGAALRKLSVEHRQVIYYCYLRQRPHAEVARLLSVPVGTIRSRLFYARDALKVALRQTGTCQFDDECRPDAA